MKRILTMQDLSCVGQCSLTVVLPVLSAYGVETCVLPTAILSNHTMFKGWSYLDLLPETEHIFNYWKSNGFAFDGFLLGYLGNQRLMDVAERCFDEFSEKNAPVIIDPVFGDNGKLYGGFDEEYVAAMRRLCRRADVILPNLTEICFMMGMEYRENYDGEYLARVLNGMAKYTEATIIVTGVEMNGLIGEAIYRKGETEYVLSERLPERLHGTGDIFSAVFTAKYLEGASLAESCAEAGNFVADCIRATDRSHFYGASFEKVLAERGRTKK